MTRHYAEGMDIDYQFTEIPGALACERCGALVWSSYRHDLWHEAIAAPAGPVA